MKFFNLKDLVNKISKENILDYIQVLNCLKSVYNSNYELIDVINNFKEFIEYLPSHIHIYIAKKENLIIGSGTLVIERNFIENYKIGHIEEIQLNNKFNDSFHKNEIISFLKNKADSLKCHKIII